MKKALESYLVFLEAGGRARRTVQTYQQRLGWLFGWLEGRGIVELDGIGPEHLDAYVAGLYHRDLSLVTIAGCVQAAKTFFRWCEGRNYLERSPASHLTKPALPRGGRSKAMALTDLRKLVEEAERRAEAGHPRDLAVITLLADSGARVGELVGLELDDLVLDEHTAWVDGKTGPRAIDFTERTSAALWAWLAVRPDVDHQSVFVAVGGSSRGEALTAYAVRGILRRLAGKAGVTGRVNPHSIRHLVGQSWSDKSVNPELIRRKLGHADVVTTLSFYSNQDRERVRQATEQFSLVGEPAPAEGKIIPFPRERVRRGAAKVAK